MDWDRYKRVCDSPEVFSRWMLVQTMEILKRREQRDRQSAEGPGSPEWSAPYSTLSSALEGKPLAKPDDHRGDGQTDMFRLELPADQARRVLAAVREAVAAGAATSGTCERGLGGFIEAWSEYSAWLNKAAQQPESEERTESTKEKRHAP